MPSGLPPSNRRALAPGAAARVTDDSLHLPGQIVTVIGSQKDETASGALLVQVRTSDRRTASLPPCFLEPLPDGAGHAAN